jgi:hypothetical protein
MFGFGPEFNSPESEPRLMVCEKLSCKWDRGVECVQSNPSNSSRINLRLAKASSFLATLKSQRGKPCPRMSVFRKRKITALAAST